MDLQRIVEVATSRANHWVFSAFESKNGEYLKKLQAENVEFRIFDKAILDSLKSQTKEVLEDITAKDEASKTIYTAYQEFQTKISGWADYSERVYYKNF